MVWRLAITPVVFATLLACAAPAFDVDASVADAAMTDVTAVDTAVDAGAADLARPDVASAGDSSALGVELNPDWIGGGCASPADCSQVNVPLCEVDGFPGGMCTQECSLGGSGAWICPDLTGALITTTRCIDTGVGAARCVAECDFALSSTGCRPGYSCHLRFRYQASDRVFPVCLPTHSQGWPGQPAADFDIGAACGSDRACGYLACLDLPGGYCAKTMCEFSGCPDGSTCIDQFGVDFGACMKDCAGVADCRGGENYLCGADNVCVSGS